MHSFLPPLFHTSSPCCFDTYDIEGVDTLKSTGAGVQKLGVNIFDNSLDEVLTNHHIVSRQNSTDSLCEKCNTCSNLGACWGGYFPHRFDDKGSFTNTSVYCWYFYHGGPATRPQNCRDPSVATQCRPHFWPRPKKHQKNVLFSTTRD